jgi:hypothetical protein
MVWNTHYLIVAEDKEPLPLAFSVEAGAYINAIRSALDILAVTLAKRHGVTGKALDNIYFPIVASEAVFRSGHFKGHKLIDILPVAERAIIEGLKPYNGGNGRLYALHQLDIVRKHVRVLFMEPNPANFSMAHTGSIERHFKPLATFWERTPNETVLGFWPKAQPKPKVYYTAYVGLNEAGALAREPLVGALDKLASLANSIIGLFDNP